MSNSDSTNFCPPTWSPETYLKALSFAEKAHKDQKITGTDLPYLGHLSRVTMEVIHALAYNPSLNGDLAISCALLHDVIEDTTVIEADVRREFGDEITNGVLALTKDKSLPKVDSMRDSLNRIKNLSPEIAIVKLADRITNLASPPPSWTADKRIAYRDEAKEILNALYEASSLLASRLLQKINNYQTYIDTPL